MYTKRIYSPLTMVIWTRRESTYGRIWEARKIWGGIVNTSRAWAIMVDDFITNQFADEPAAAGELRSIKKALILRHVAWLTALRHAMRKGRPWERFNKHKENREWSDKIKVHEHNQTVQEDMRGYLSASPSPRCPARSRSTCAR